MPLSEHILTCLKKYAVFRGRATRAEYWSFTIANIVLISIVGTRLIDNLTIILAMQLAVLFPQISVTVRRLHDTGRTGWWTLVWFTILLPSIFDLSPIPAAITLAPNLIILGFLVQRSEDADNKYGEAQHDGESMTLGDLRASPDDVEKSRSEPEDVSDLTAAPSDAEEDLRRGGGETTEDGVHGAEAFDQSEQDNAGTSPSFWETNVGTSILDGVREIDVDEGSRDRLALLFLGGLVGFFLWGLIGSVFSPNFWIMGVLVGAGALAARPVVVVLQGKRQELQAVKRQHSLESMNPKERKKFLKKEKKEQKRQALVAEIAKAMPDAGKGPSGWTIFRTVGWIVLALFVFLVVIPTVLGIGSVAACLSMLTE